MPGSPKYSNLIAAIATIASCDIALGFTLQLLPPIVGAAIDRFGVAVMPVSLAAIYVMLLIGLAASGGRLIREAPHG